MTDLRKVVARALAGPEKPNGWHYIKADAVLSAIGERHAIVERVGEDVVEAAHMAALKAVIAAGFGEKGHVGAMSISITASAPIIAAHARDAALEEAATMFDVEAAHATEKGLDIAAGVFVQNADRIRALKSGGQHG